MRVNMKSVDFWTPMKTIETKIDIQWLNSTISLIKWEINKVLFLLLFVFALSENNEQKCQK